MATCLVIGVGDEEHGYDVWLLRESWLGPRKLEEICYKGRELMGNSCYRHGAGVRPWDGDSVPRALSPAPLQQRDPLCLKVCAGSTREDAQGWLGSRLTTRRISRAQSRGEQVLALGSRNQSSSAVAQGSHRSPQ